jgi:hypothetical protein
MDHAQEQEMELQAIEAIYADDYKKLDECTAGGTATFEVTLVPEAGAGEDVNHVCVAMRVAYTATYPEAPPELSLRAIRKGELTDEMILGKVTMADGRNVTVYGTEKAYIVPELKTKTEPEGLRLGRAILQKEIEPDQAFKLLAEGKTDLLKGFVSNRTKRPFDAHLTMDFEKGKIGFEFPARAPKAKK